MVIAVQRGLARLAARLREMGHEVVVFGEGRRPVDVLVYDKGHDAALISAVRVEEGAGQNIFLINANGKTAEEIDKIIHRRLYTPLF